MAIGRVSKDADAEEPFQIDWSKYLPAGFNIALSTWVIEGFDDGIMTLPFNKILAGNITKVWVKGGTPGKQYKIVNHIVTDVDADAQKVTDEESIVIYVTQR